MRSHAYVMAVPNVWPHLCAECLYGEDHPVHKGFPVGLSIVDPNADWSIVDLSVGARVARGVLYIDRAYPSKLETLDVARFDIQWCTSCVIGQIHGTFVHSPEYVLGGDFLRAHGFLPFMVPGVRTFVTDAADLDFAWCEAIRAAGDRT